MRRVSNLERRCLQHNLAWAYGLQACGPAYCGSSRESVGPLGGATVGDIGAGTGNCSRAPAATGYNIKAIEPSQVMTKRSTGDIDFSEQRDKTREVIAELNQIAIVR